MSSKTPNNSLEIQVSFSYKGEVFDCRSTLDLDLLSERTTELPDLHREVAQRNNIDTYSYLYEVMESQPLQFSQATGVAQECLQGSQFDWVKFRQLKEEQRLFTALTKIAQQHLEIDDLNQHPKIKAALTAAYLANNSESQQ